MTARNKQEHVFPLDERCEFLIGTECKLESVQCVQFSCVCDCIIRVCVGVLMCGCVVRGWQWGGRGERRMYMLFICASMWCTENRPCSFISLPCYSIFFPRISFRYINRLFRTLYNRPSTHGTQGLKNGRSAIGLWSCGTYAGLKYVRCRVGYKCLQNSMFVSVLSCEPVCLFLFFHVDIILSKAIARACICVDMRS